MEEMIKDGIKQGLSGLLSALKDKKNRKMISDTLKESKDILKEIGVALQDKELKKTVIDIGKEVKDIVKEIGGEK